MLHESSWRCFKKIDSLYKIIMSEERVRTKIEPEREREREREWTVSSDLLIRRYLQTSRLSPVILHLEQLREEGQNNTVFMVPVNSSFEFESSLRISQMETSMETMHNKHLARCPISDQNVTVCLLLSLSLSLSLSLPKLIVSSTILPLSETKNITHTEDTHTRKRSQKSVSFSFDVER